MQVLACKCKGAQAPRRPSKRRSVGKAWGEARHAGRQGSKVARCQEVSKVSRCEEVNQLVSLSPIRRAPRRELVHARPCQGATSLGRHTNICHLPMLPWPHHAAPLPAQLPFPPPNSTSPSWLLMRASSNKMMGLSFSLMGLSLSQPLFPRGFALQSQLALGLSFRHAFHLS